MSNSDFLLAGGSVVLEDRIIRSDILIRDGCIAGLLPPVKHGQGGHIVDVSGKHILPGVIDVHFHIRAPSYPERGTVSSETRAAAAGGVTTIFEMPISKPCCNTAAILEDRRKHFSSEAVVNFGLYGAPGASDAAGVKAMVEAGAIAFKIFTTAAPPNRDAEFLGLSLPDEMQQLQALQLVAATGRLTVVHAESEPMMASFMARAASLECRNASAHLSSRPSIVEAVAVAKILTMARHAGAPVHIAHVTSRAALDVIRAFRAVGTDVSAETCPHYLLFTNDDVERAQADGKINPPIRTADDRDALWGGILDGTLTIVTTDHAPFSKREKDAARGDMLAAPPGSPGVEFLLPFMLDAVADGRLPLWEAIKLVTSNGARRFGIYPDRGVIRSGGKADLTVVDLSRETVVDPAKLYTAAREVAGLYAGRRFKGAVDLTIVGGRIVYENGQVTGKPGDGKFVSGAPLAPT